MEFSMPPDFVPATPANEPAMATEYAIRHRDIELEIRYAIRPIDRMVVEYDDPHGLAPDPDTLYPLMFRALVERISTDFAPQSEFDSTMAQREFGADWGNAAVVSTGPHFGRGYDYCLILMLHKSHTADAYAFYLFQGESKHRAMPLITDALHALRFLPTNSSATDPIAGRP